MQKLLIFVALLCKHQKNRRRYGVRLLCFLFMLICRGVFLRVVISLLEAVCVFWSNGHDMMMSSFITGDSLKSINGRSYNWEPCRPAALSASESRYLVLTLTVTNGRTRNTAWLEYTAGRTNPNWEFTFLFGVYWYPVPVKYWPKLAQKNPNSIFSCCCSHVMPDPWSTLHGCEQTRFSFFTFSVYNTIPKYGIFILTRPFGTMYVYY